ncbi:MAG: hypothetical protein ACI924_002272, partial [Flavobacterium sp.]
LFFKKKPSYFYDGFKVYVVISYSAATNLLELLYKKLV